LGHFKKKILSLGCRAAFIQASEALLAVSHWGLDSVCFRFAGVENPLKVSRYPFARPFWQLLDKSQFSALDHVNVILATADQDAIDALVSRSHGRLARERLVQIPTCVDTALFSPRRADSSRTELGIPAHYTVFVNSGRISRFKGWQLLLGAFEHFLSRDSEALLFFVGDGEDRSLLQEQIVQRNLGSRVKITGFQTPNQIVSYLTAADVALFGSFVEGWSTAMLEALACGKPLVSTEVSGTDSLVIPGRNGFIVHGRNPVEFASAMEGALHLAEAERVSTSIASRFDLAHLGEKLAHLWPPLSGIATKETNGDGIKY
jgi:glycosyltransferase involved in cell wall biosynthesis